MKSAFDRSHVWGKIMAVAVATGLCALAAEAQNNTTLLADGTTTNLGGPLTFGGTNNLLHVLNGGVVIDTEGRIGYTGSGSKFNTALIEGANSLWSNTAAIYVGYQGPGNRLIVSNQATVTSTSLNLGFDGGSSNNFALITGANTLVTNGGNVLIGRNTILNQMIISNGAVMYSQLGTLGGMVGGDQNSAIIIGSNSQWITTGSYDFYVGNNGTSNTLLIADGAVLNDRIGVIGYGDSTPNSDYNSALVTGPGSVWTNRSTIIVGRKGIGNQLTISNGGALYASLSGGAGAVSVGRLAGSEGRIVVTGQGSLLSTLGHVNVGSNAHTLGTGHILVTDGATLEANTLVSGFNSSGTISNRGGVFQFTMASPTITANTTDSIVLTNGTISFRGITTASPYVGGTSLTNIAFQGNNTFQLNNATNTSIASYTFDSVANTGTPTNYQRLALANGARWRSTALTIGSGGALIGNGTVASANVTNLGTIAPGFSAGEITFTNNLVLGASSVLAMEIGGTNAANYDRLIVGGTATLDGTLVVAPIDSFSPAVGDTFTLIDALAISGQFAGLTNNQFLDASQNGMDAFFRIQYDTGNGDVLLIATIPEPSAVIWFAGAALALLLRRRAAHTPSSETSRQAGGLKR